VIALVLGTVALVVAVAALVLTIIVMRQSGETTTDLRMHRRAHTIAHGHADPKLDRRQVQLGPPRSIGERRGMQRFPEPRERYAPRPVDDDATGELEQVELPTSMLEQQPPSPLRPGERPGPSDVRDVRRRP
jgi:hypothetical protein